MSELTDRWFWAYPTESVDCDGITGSAHEVYSKSEADKVIATLTDKANYYERAYKNKSEELADTCRFYEDELRHSNYKRCLAMKQLCYDRWIRAYHSNKLEETRFYVRWQKRWMELAEKFKEDK